MVTRKLARMKWRFLALSSVISLAMAMLVAGMYTGEVLDHSVETYFRQSRMPDVFVELSRPQNESELAAVIAATPGIGAAELRLKLAGTLERETGSVAALLIGVRDPGRTDINRLKVESGRLFSASGEAVAVAGMESSGLDRGASLRFNLSGKSLRLNITGTVTGPEFVMNSAYSDYLIPVQGSLAVVIMPLGDLQALFGPVVNDVLVLVGPGGTTEAVVRPLEGLGVRSVTLQESHPSRMFMDIAAGKMRGLMPVMSLIFMAAGLISIFMTMMKLVQNDSRYIGVLMSLGYGRGEIARSYMLLGAALCAIASVAGVILGVLFTRGIVEVTLAMFFQVEVAFPFSPAPFLAGVGYTLGCVLLSTGAPVLLLTRKKVKEALEYKPGIRVRRSRASGGRMSMLAVMGLRNAARDPKRAAVTVAVVALTIGLSGSWLIMMDSAFGYMGGQLSSDTWHLRAEFLAPVENQAVNASFLGLGPGDAEYIVPYTVLKAEAASGSGHSSVLVIACDELERTKRFSVESGSLDLDRAVLSNTMARELGVGPGDTIRLGLGAQSVTLEVGGVVSDVLGGVVYTKRAGVAGLAPVNTSLGAYVRLADPSAAERKAGDMRGLPAVSRVVVHADIERDLGGLLSQTLGMLYFFFVLNLMLTIAVAGSAVIISSMERDLEYATLDTLGVSRTGVVKAILVEMGVLALLAAIAAVPLAYGLAEVMALVMQDVLFLIPIVFVLGATVLTVAMGAAFVMLSSFVPIRYAAGLDTGRTIRERTVA